MLSNLSKGISLSLTNSSKCLLLISSSEIATENCENLATNELAIGMSSFSDFLVQTVFLFMFGNVIFGVNVP